MPNDFLYSMAHAARKGTRKTETPDPMRGVTDPTKLLRSDTQRIDKNVYTPETIWQRAPQGGGSSEMAGKEIKSI